MPAARRQIISGKVYEIEIRARRGLPFVALALIRLLLASAMARTQRDAKLIIGHFLWMANHLHILVLVKDAEQAKNFYTELTKRITDYMKPILGLDYLNLWESGGPVVSQVLNLNSLIERISYLYCNPARAQLVDHVSQYPGFSSWEWFKLNPMADSIGETVPWVRVPSLSKLPSRKLTRRQDAYLTRLLKDKNKRFSHELTISPRALYGAFGVTEDAEIERLNASVFFEIENTHHKISQQNDKPNKAPKNPERLRDEPIFKDHTPKRKSTDRKVLFHTTEKELALKFLREFKAFCDACRQAYLAWRAGDTRAQWPPGAFRPPMRPLANAL